MAKQKPVSVNLSTKANEIIATMREEIPVAMYHFRKQYGGRNKYMKYEDELLDKALAEEESQITDMGEYISRVGNRWITYTMAEYFQKAKYANATRFSFIYYETYGSCGAFFPLYSSQGEKKLKKNKKKDGQADGVMIFTSHFFQRMSERTGKAYRSKELIQEFISTKSTQASQTDEDGDVIVKFKGGYGFGVEKSKSPRVVEVRTYLTDKQLTPNQRRKVEQVDAFAELIKDGMYLKEVALNAAYHTYNTPEKAAQEGLKKIDAFKKLGVEKPMMLWMMIHLCFVRILEDLLHMEITTPQSALICQLETECGMDDMVCKYIDFDGSTATEEENNQFMADAIDLFCKIARKMKLKSVNRDTITERINEIMADSKEKAEEYTKEAN